MNTSLLPPSSITKESMYALAAGDFGHAGGRLHWSQVCGDSVALQQSSHGNAQRRHHVQQRPPIKLVRRLYDEPAGGRTSKQTIWPLCIPEHIPSNFG